MAIIVPVTCNQYALIDDQDWRLLQYSWIYSNGYARRHYRKTDGTRTTVSMHREIMGFPDVSFEVDHKNGNRLDNRRSNLRLATRYQNLSNSKPHSDKWYKGKGVTRLRNGRYIARITIDKKTKQLGTFGTAEEASKAYRRRAREVYGEFVYPEE